MELGVSVMRLAPIAVLLLLATAQTAAQIASGQTGGAAGACSSLTVSYGTAYKYNTGYPTKYVGSDIWFNTWADTGNITASNDSLWGWAGNNTNGSNFAVSQLSTTDTTTTGTSVNTMAPWGSAGQSDAGTPSDGFSFKAGGIISVNGVWYVAVNRATNSTPAAPYQYMLQNMQLIKSTDHGASWHPLPPVDSAPVTAAHYTSPMFTGYQMGNADFLQYGQNYQGQTADNSSVYVYAYATEGPYNNANNLYLARVKIANIGNQLASDWTYYQGGDGMLDANWSSTWQPYPLISANKTLGASVGTQYFATLGCYVRLNWWYPSVAAGTGIVTTSTIWQPWAAPHPWGPWSIIGPQFTWSAEPGVGLFSPHIMPASLAPSGNNVTATALAAGDYNSQGQSTGDYTMTMVPVTVTKNQ